MVGLRRQGMRAVLMGVACVVCGGLLGGCVSGKPAPDIYTSRAGTVTMIESDRESCVRSCNDEYARCNDMLATAHNAVGSDPGSRTFGIDAECRDSLKTCLPRCKSR